MLTKLGWSCIAMSYVKRRCPCGIELLCRASQPDGSVDLVRYNLQTYGRFQDLPHAPSRRLFLFICPQGCSEESCL